MANSTLSSTNSPLKETTGYFITCCYQPAPTEQDKPTICYKLSDGTQLVETVYNKKDYDQLYQEIFPDDGSPRPAMHIHYDSTGVVQSRVRLRGPSVFYTTGLCDTLPNNNNNNDDDGSPRLPAAGCIKRCSIL